MRHIVKIAENNVEVTESKKVTASDGTEVEIYEGTKRSYGQQLINDHLAVREAGLLAAKSLDEKKHKADKIIKCQADIDKVPALRVIVPTKTVEDINGNTVEVFDHEGEDHFEELISDISLWRKRLTEAKTLDARQYKKDLITKAQKAVDEINAIQVEMDK